MLMNRLHAFACFELEKSQTNPSINENLSYQSQDLKMMSRIPVHLLIILSGN